MKTFREYFNFLYSEDTDFDKRYGFGKQFEDELAKELSDVVSSNQKYKVVIPNIEEQKEWLAKQLSTYDNKIDPKDAVQIFNKADKYVRGRIMGEFGGEFGDVIVDKFENPNDYENALLRIDTKVGGSISLRSMARFLAAEGKKDNFYLVKQGGKNTDLTLIKLTRFLFAKIVKNFNLSHGVKYNFDKFKLKHGDEKLKSGLKDGYKKMPSGDIGISLPKIKSLATTGDIKNFKTTKEFAAYAIKEMLK